MSSLVQRLLRSERGNVAMIFGLALTVIVGVIGLAVDLTMAHNAKRTIQDSLDTAVLAAAISGGNDEEVLKKAAMAAFASNNQVDGLSASITSFSYDEKLRVVSAKADGTYKPFLMGLFGFDTIPYSVVSDSVRGSDGTLEVALVLDNTWSMSANLPNGQQKIAVLKTAAKALVSAIMIEDNKDFVKVAIVPYADYVNVGMSNRNASWMSVASDYSTTSAKTCKTVSTQTTCTGGVSGTCTRVKDGVTESYSCWKVPQTCTTKNVTPYQSCSGGNTTNYKWYGCVRNQMQSSKLVMPDPKTAYVGILQTSQTCLNPILTLNNSKTTVDSAINNLVVNIGGYKPETYIPAGLIWGVNVLSPPAPFTDPRAYDPENRQPRKTIVLMTDGANTLYSKPDGTIAVGNTTQVGVTFKDQVAVCDYAKSKNIEVYTIGFNVIDTTALATLKSCATDAQHYFDAKSPEDLIAAFETIGGNLSTVRLTR